MAAKRVQQRHRHYKTLIVLVVSMTIGTFLLYGMAQISPVTPLRSRTAAQWNRVSIRAVPSDAPRGFYHFRIDDAGRLLQSGAWEAGQFDRGAPGTVFVLLSCDRADLRVSAAQADTLSQLISRLRTELSIAPENVAVENESAADGSVPSRSIPRRT